ncbi:FxsA family protein [Janibacter sp. GXQ6167]|uniref:FxsA family protein n=1 Tax=Janibacter sp. GXQ6167 TaxID=3240791 RepID=UPI003526724B
MSIPPQPTPRRFGARRVLGLFALALLIVPIIEIAVIIGVGRVIGTWPTVILLIVESAFGAWILKHEGGRAWGALAGALQSGRMPSRELADAALVLIGGVLLLTPGFVTDIVGFFLILPITRPITRRLLEAIVARRLLGGVVGVSTTRTTRTTRTTETNLGWTPSEPAPPNAPSDDVIEGEIVDDR